MFEYNINNVHSRKEIGFTEESIDSLTQDIGLGNLKLVCLEEKSLGREKEIYGWQLNVSYELNGKPKYFTFKRDLSISHGNPGTHLGKVNWGKIVQPPKQKELDSKVHKFLQRNLSMEMRKALPYHTCKVKEIKDKE